MNMPTRIVSLSLLLSGVALGADWTHWRGPNADGSAPGATPPLTWDASKNIAWKAAIPGKGSATPLVVGDRVFVLTAVDTGKAASKEDTPPDRVIPKDADPDSPRWKRMTKPTNTYHQFVVMALDLKTGKELWRDTAAVRVPHEGTHATHSYAAGSPATDGKRLYVSFGSFGIYGYSFEGKKLWSRDLGKLETRLGWGEAVTPAVHDGKVFVAFDHEGPSFLAALDAESGKILWKVPRDEPSAWTPPAVAVTKDRAEVIVAGMRRIRSYDPITGKLLWHAKGLTLNSIPSSIVSGDVVYCMSGYKGQAAAAIRLGGSGDIDGTDRVLWRGEPGTPYVPSAALSNGKLWFTKYNDGVLTVLDAKTGKSVIDGKRVGGLRSMYASPVIAGGKVYFTDRDGTTVVLKESEKAEVLAVNKLGEPVDASPVAVGGKMLLRGERHLYCVAER